MKIVLLRELMEAGELSERRARRFAKLGLLPK